MGKIRGLFKKIRDTKGTQQIDGETVETVADFIFGAPKSLQMVIAAICSDFGAPKSLQMVIAAMKLKDAYSLEGKL